MPPEPDQKPWLSLPPLYDADAKMYQTNHDNKEKTLYSQLLVCLSSSVCWHHQGDMGYQLR